ncbi:MAG: hypothetical protein ISN26_01115 [Betaproteobacteria bacterium AqS2]|uniref:Sarcosine oxidase subunit gamma n=1 Tax=Candidatus Amphirhobacter heronislandensis TaxID=1732024 RepID=A0A930XW40_9GAMM|nr:hypothetical protein [Betaproteobacteria bacterium AqS2]
MIRTKREPDNESQAQKPEHDEKVFPVNRSARTSALEGCIVSGRLAAGRLDDSQVAPPLGETDTPPSLIIAPAPLAETVQIGGIQDTKPLAEAFSLPAEDLEPGRWVLAEASGERIILAWAGPGQWLAMSDTISAARIIERASKAIEASKGTAIDLSCARTSIRLAGAAAPELLAGLCPIDIEALASGDSLFTSAQGFDIHLLVMARREFRLAVRRSLAQAMWETLLRCSRAFEVEVGALP